MKPTKAKLVAHPLMKDAKNNPIMVPEKPEPLLSAANVKELRAMFGQFDDYKIASLLISLAAFPDGMSVVRSYPKDGNPTDAAHLIHARALGLVHAYVTQIPHGKLSDNASHSRASRTG